jgi:predicted amidohydrolase
LPELFATGYFFQSRDDLLSVVEPVPDGRTTGFSVYALETKDGEAYRLGVMICFDWYFPEAARTLALQGADIIAHPSNLVRPDCPRSMPIRALENHVFTVTANRYGQESSSGESLTFIGQSEICDPQGKILVHAPEAADAVDAVTIDPTNARDRDITTHNHIFDDRRVDQYTIR